MSVHLHALSLALTWMILRSHALYPAQRAASVKRDLPSAMASVWHVATVAASTWAASLPPMRHSGQTGSARSAATATAQTTVSTAPSHPVTQRSTARRMKACFSVSQGQRPCVLLLVMDTFCHLEVYHLTSRAAVLFVWPPLSVERGTRKALGD